MVTYIPLWQFVHNFAVDTIVFGFVAKWSLVNFTVRNARAPKSNAENKSCDKSVWNFARAHVSRYLDMMLLLYTDTVVTEPSYWT